MNGKRRNRLLALLLTVVMVVGMLPMAALAAEEGEYDPATDDSRDYPLQVKRLTVNSHDNQGNKPGYMLDGDYNTQWVAGWGKGGEGPAAECAEDNWIQITLLDPIKVQGIRYQARYDGLERGYASGGFGGWRLETSDDGITWTNTVTGNWGVEGTPENEAGKVQFEGPYYKPESSEWYYAGWEEPVETRYIRLTATQLYAYEEHNKNYGSCAEIRLVMAEGAQAPTEVAYDCVLAENGPEDGGVYAIFTNRASGLETELTMNSLLYYSGTGAVTNQVAAGAISDDVDRQYLDLNHDRTFFPVETQLWQAIETEDGWLLKSLAGGRNMYLELSLNGSGTHAHAKVNYKPQTLTIEATTSQKNSYKILQQDGETCCSLNWSGSGYWTHDGDNDFPLRFYRWNGEELATEADVYAVAAISDQTYTGSAIRPAVTVTKNGAEMTGGYTVEYRNNIEVGTATVAIKVNDCIVAETTFRIVEAPLDVYAIAAISDQTYTGSAIEPAVAVTKNGEAITEGFAVEYDNNIEVGTATVAIKVDGETVAETTFQIVPASTSGEEPENPGEEPENPGEEPENPGDNTGDDVPSKPSTPSKPVVTTPVEPTEDLDDPDVPLAELPMQFEDVTEDDWFFEGVKYTFDNDLMEGLSDTEFAPFMNTTRGMIVTILHRAEGKPEVAELSDFTDVEADKWYTLGVAWGQAEEVAEGFGDGSFRPMTDVTREQMVAFLYRYARYKGYDITARGELSSFRDGETTSAWAAEYVRWAIGAGLLEGRDDNTLDPKNTATRGEVALILMRFCENFMK